MSPRVSPAPLLRLQLRLWASSSRQWLFSVGLMPDRDAAALGYAYAFYALALGLLWIGSSWGALVTLTLEVARAMPQAAGQGLGRSLPSLFGLGLVVLSILALLGMPLHLSGADVAHVGGARVSRRMLAILRFLPAALGAAAIALPLGTVLAVLSTQSPRHYLVAMAVLLPLVVGAYAAYWAIGLGRLALPCAAASQGRRSGSSRSRCSPRSRSTPASRFGPASCSRRPRCTARSPRRTSRLGSRWDSS